MPISSVSDFERFAAKSRQSIVTKIKRAEAEASLYALRKEKETAGSLERWCKQSHAQWKQELYIREQQGERVIADEVNSVWSAFKKERTNRLKEALKLRLEQEFEVLATCFVSWVSQRYETGTFTLPKVLMPSVDQAKFAIHEGEKQQVLFVSGNLYIEYSVTRILDELGDEIVRQMHFEENEWQA